MPEPANSGEIDVSTSTTAARSSQQQLFNSTSSTTTTSSSSTSSSQPPPLPPSGQQTLSFGAPKAKPEHKKKKKPKSSNALPPGVRESDVALLMDMGFPRKQVINALVATHGNQTAAIDHVLNAIKDGVSEESESEGSSYESEEEEESNTTVTNAPTSVSLAANSSISANNNGAIDDDDDDDTLQRSSTGGSGTDRTLMPLKSTTSRFIRTSKRSQLQRSRALKESDASEQAEYDDEFDDYETEWFLDEGGEEDEQMFEILEKNELKKILLDMIREVSIQLDIPLGQAQLLLRSFKWSQDKLLANYFDDISGSLKKAGIILPEDGGSDGTNGGGDDDSDTFECPVCFDDVPIDESYALCCGHRYCAGCWEGHLSAMIETLGKNVTTACCMHPGCKAVVSYTAWEKLVPPSLADRYWYFTLKEFVEYNSRSYVFCSNATCGRTIHYKGTGHCSDVVECECGRRFCFNCGMEKHNPASCEQFDKWRAKETNDEESDRLLKATTKPCFHCGFPTERNQGCNHMTCSRCKGEWCWMCRGDWKTHGSHTGGFYTCNKYETSDAKKIDDWAKNYMVDNERYKHYYERYFNHNLSKNEIEKKAPGLKREADQFWLRTGINCSVIGEALDLVMECRDVLKYTYVYGFYLENSKEKDFFEYLQSNAEGITERLSDIVIKPIKEIDIDSLKNIVRVTKKYLRNLVVGIENGLTS